jgi:hypothetical protein
MIQLVVFNVHHHRMDSPITLVSIQVTSTTDKVPNQSSAYNPLFLIEVGLLGFALFPHSSFIYGLLSAVNYTRPRKFEET